ncbi:MAG TPA: sugar transferase [Patescibacteria group bacterium]|nr:sugar transferase [Patescibacteria group bacterium]
MLAKRLFDLLFTVPGVLLLLPVFAAIAIWIKLDDPGTIFFRQERVGRHGKIFRIFKFRTMVNNAERLGTQITVGADRRITRAGAFLRKYKLDELPQLLNVVLGDMSLVGPRPEVPKYVAYYPEAVRKNVLSVPPGLTDFASIQYRDENALLGSAPDPEKMYVEVVLPAKLAYCERYVEERSLTLDFQLIMKTLKAISGR